MYNFSRYVFTLIEDRGKMGPFSWGVFQNFGEAFDRMVELCDGADAITDESPNDDMSVKYSVINKHKHWCDVRRFLIARAYYLEDSEKPIVKELREERKRDVKCRLI